VSGWQQDIVHTILGRRAPEKEIARIPPSLAEMETPPTGIPL
jgi:methyl coenzyme M reductase gamma subunit